MSDVNGVPHGRVPGLADPAQNQGLAVAPSLDVALSTVKAPPEAVLLDRRTLMISALSIALAAVAGCVAQLLAGLIGLVTNLAYYGKVSTSLASPSHHHLGYWAVLVPVLGGLIVGVMARYGSPAIRGHGIPEAMEQVLNNQSRIPPRITLLKPLSAAVAIGTGGPFGAEGPIIATGGALGSLLGQILRVSAVERKTLLAAGAAAGMAATFGTPVAAVVLAVELLLFEFRPRSLVPVALATATATGVRYALVGSAAVFPLPGVADVSGEALVFYLGLGLLMGVASVLVTKLVYFVEDVFDHLPMHWMWWPAIGGLAVGLVGLVAPRTLGVGYENIEDILNGRIVGGAILTLAVWKFVSWSISLGSGTSGGTLAPMFTMGAGLGFVFGLGGQHLMPGAAIDPRVAALVGMAALFAGASRALLASVIFAFETTRQPAGLLPLLGGCTVSYLLSCVLMQNTIMTEKIARRGTRVPAEYSADLLEQIAVREVGLKPVVTLETEQTLEQVRTWLLSSTEAPRHHGFPLVRNGRLVGVLTRRDIFESALPANTPLAVLLHRSPAVVFEDSTLRQAADHMVRENVGRLPVVTRENPDMVQGILTRSDLLAVQSRRLEEVSHKRRHIQLRRVASKPN